MNHPVQAPGKKRGVKNTAVVDVDVIPALMQKPVNGVERFCAVAGLIEKRQRGGTILRVDHRGPLLEVDLLKLFEGITEQSVCRAGPDDASAVGLTIVDNHARLFREEPIDIGAVLGI